MSPSESILVSHRQICHLISTGWRDFWQDSRNQGLNPGEGASPDSFFPSFRSAIAQLTNRRGIQIASWCWSLLDLALDPTRQIKTGGEYENYGTTVSVSSLPSP